MQCRRFLLGIALVVLFVNHLVAQSATKSAGDQEKISAKMIAGTWTIEKGMKAGEESNAEMLGSFPVQVTEKSFSMPSGAGEDFVMDYQIDNAHDPAHIDMTITAGPAPESTAKGIIAMKDGKLMLCYQPTGGDRPTAFESTADNGNFMFAMKRQSETMDAGAIIGTWKYVSGKRAGTESPADNLLGDVVVSKKTFTLPAGDGEKFVMAYQLDLAQSPATIDFEIESGPVPEGTALGIIKMDGEQMVLCYDPAGANRPRDFDSTEDNGFFLFVLKPAGE